MKDILNNKLIKFRGAILPLLLTLGISLNSFAQNRQITGKVTSSDNGGALAGVSVKVKGTTTGTLTNVSGAFSLSVPSNATLVFSYIGYVSQEVVPGNSAIIDIKLVPDINTLTEVAVVSVGYGTQKRKRRNRSCQLG